ncbi:MAG: HD domain-containing protein [Emcibacter sp.]|nr:HD domain-containing protein [Emcibacter sp.]
MSEKSHITIIQDNNIKNKSYIDLVKHYKDIILVDVNSVKPEDLIKSTVIIVQVDLNDQNSITPLKEIMLLPERSHIPTLFLLHEFSRREVVQANTLGATDYTVYPCPDKKFIQLLENLINRTVEKAWEKLTEIQEEALKVSLKVVEKTFHNAARGLEVSQDDVKDSCNLIVEATAKDGLNDWMDAIKQHHNSTYRHSMMVCGYLVSFGMLIGIKKSDLQLLAIGGMVHDIGKAAISLEILEKPTKLTKEEQKIMDNHPNDSKLILKGTNWDEVIVDIAAHHHENLDGSGYPDGLKGDEISDIVRTVSIANVFADLTDKRSNKPAMTAEKAFETMLGMENKLDISLVKAFRPVVIPEEE